MTEADNQRLEALPPLRDVIATHDLRARKSLGQNFLLDLNLTRRIARLAGPLADRTVIEVGPGPGGLTRALLLEGAREVVAIEQDIRCRPALEQIGAAAPGRLRLIEGDAKRVDMVALSAPPRAVVANLPYNVASRLLIGWLRRIGAFVGLTLMFQGEVAERITAAPGGRSYGRLSVMSQWLTRPRIAMRLPARAFTPAPNVESAVVHFTPHPRPAGIDPPPEFAAMEHIVAASFAQRRKMLQSALKPLGAAPVRRALAQAGIDGSRRAETLTPAEFAHLATALSPLPETGPSAPLPTSPR